VTEGTDTVVLYDELAVEDVLPVLWEVLEQERDPFVQAATDDSNHLLLQACVAVEERPVREKTEEGGPLHAELARMELKLNLVLKLLGDLMQHGERAPLARVRFNSIGASWWPAGAKPPPGERGILRIHLRSALPQTLDLAAVVTSVERGEVKLLFDEIPEALAELIGRLIFLRHRRKLSEVKKSRSD
jgi:hypothetical protein